MSKKEIPLVDLRRQYAAIGSEIEDAVLEVLRSGNFVCGRNVASLEEDFAAAHDCKYAVGVNSGTAALHVALWAIGIKPGDEVILPVNTFIATAEAVSLCGATPVFIDHDEHFAMNPDHLEEIITPRTKAVIAVHLYGQPAGMDAILEICSAHNLTLLEDCAQSHLAEYNGRKTGSIGAAGCFSFYPGKNLGACGEAGAVVTNDAELADKMRQLRQHGIADDRYRHLAPGHNYRMSEIQGAALRVKMKYIADWTERRRQVADGYFERLADIGEIQLPWIRPNAKPVYHLFVIRCRERDALLAYLRDNGIGAGLHYPLPLHLQPAYQSLGGKAGDFPLAEQCAGEILSLPIFPELTDDEMDYICEHVRKFYTD